MPPLFQSTPEGILRAILHAPAASSDRRAILLDRDGVINERIGGSYVTRWAEFKFVRGIVDAISKISRLGLPVILVSNQAGVGKGLMTEVSLEEITWHLEDAFASQGARIDAVYYCPHRPEEGCTCRKPAPGLLLQAAADFHLDLQRSIFIGDTASDLAAADAVGCAFIQLRALPETQVIDVPGREINVRTPADLPEAVRAHFRSMKEVRDR